jgi:predicted RNA-binding protein associated with RNAse of E/G family
MSIHPPRRISSIEGLGLPSNTRSIEYLPDGSAITTEIWNEMPEPWKQGDTVIALPGYKWVTKWEEAKPYIVNKFFDSNSVLIGVYCDVARLVRKIEGGFEFDDLYLDVWQVPGSEPEILDEDELQEAVEAELITKEEAESARDVAKKVLSLLSDDIFLTF